MDAFSCWCRRSLRCRPTLIFVLAGLVVLLESMVIIRASRPAPWVPGPHAGPLDPRTVGVRGPLPRPESDDANRDANRNQVCRIGEPAPDIELPSASDTVQNSRGKADAPGRRVAISSFRGKKVLCLFLSSYT